MHSKYYNNIWKDRVAYKYTGEEVTVNLIGWKIRNVTKKEFSVWCTSFETSDTSFYTLHEKPSHLRLTDECNDYDNIVDVYEKL